MTPEELARLKALAEVATPGPWRVEVYGHDHADDEFDGADAWSVEAGDPPRTSANIVERTVAAFDRFFHPTLAKAERKADADFTAAARTAVPALLDEVERLRNCEPNPPPLTDESLRTELRGVYDALDGAMRERDTLRAWEAEARAAMKAAVRHLPGPDDGRCRYEYPGDTCGMAGGRCTHSADIPEAKAADALRAVLARKVT